MTLQVWFCDDVRAHVVAVVVAALSAAVATGAPNVEHCRGTLDTARGFALSFGLDWTSPAPYVTTCAPRTSWLCWTLQVLNCCRGDNGVS